MWIFQSIFFKTARHDQNERADPLFENFMEILDSNLTNPINMKEVDKYIAGFKIFLYMRSRTSPYAQQDSHEMLNAFLNDMIEYSEWVMQLPRNMCVAGCRNFTQIYDVFKYSVKQDRKCQNPIHEGKNNTHTKTESFIILPVAVIRNDRTVEEAIMREMNEWIPTPDWRDEDG
jgi:hypothetical protein